MTEDEIIELIHEHIDYYAESISKMKKNLANSRDIYVAGISSKIIQYCSKLSALRDLLEDITGDIIEDEDL